MLLNYHIGHFVLGSLCVGDLVRMALSSVRVAGFSLDILMSETWVHKKWNKIASDIKFVFYSTMKISTCIGPRFPGGPLRSRSLYWLSYSQQGKSLFNLNYAPVNSACLLELTLPPGNSVTSYWVTSINTAEQTLRLGISISGFSFCVFAYWSVIVIGSSARW